MYVEFGLVTKVNATKWLFPLLVRTRGDLREHIYATLLVWEEPDSILIAALGEYYKHGNEERLALAASLLADIGAPALPALRVLIRSGTPECEMFVSVIAGLRGVSVQSRLAVLTQVTTNPSSDVRYRLLKGLSAFAPHEVIQLLQTLSRDEDADIADEAQAWLEYLKTES